MRGWGWGRILLFFLCTLLCRSLSPFLGFCPLPLALKRQRVSTSKVFSFVRGRLASLLVELPLPTYSRDESHVAPSALSHSVPK